ncbi:Aspartyl/glutamyl-tRNA(Asn/Gln) amidotransferase, subunit C [Nitrospina gracilis 3/211]|uniref:Aspartyl/glutamyl-tRNA(Asn/Gln) amidotransferase subunit C n=1 Tax=Nitrospina gracilis (strain 3/211) TaxID=1266370 RepID=M1Z8D6_NITG3|nr:MULTISPECIES: Asp-tRNA(Asn)/Glu-tRNA(Gln) amidotransferase subunit GatC [Nitrospina]MCF8722090.1 aspartyl-tRNA(Asn)/glutamyl-tRNA(Gln) amidotransferase subunit C [Nitrospina sp. Nb-3]CCQ89279.1 Aspartyl/glutamyl-tRNA(Asn/Gln) amidotransferase, subunit C [Nitrospina gracilis 3/211]
MSHDNVDIQKIAHLARLELTPEEREKLGPQFQKIVEYIDHLGTLNTENVEPTSHVLPLQNVLREDEVVARFPEADYLRLAPRAAKGHYEVPKIIS